MRNIDMEEEEEVFSDSGLDLMAEVSEEEIQDFASSEEEDLGHLLGIDLDTVDNIDKNPFD